ncbi:MAG TPA: hypothetical protein DD473_16305 [Planctomycetaceae bacterium]|nr:hypothetical protein [Planctomycetaceae bacterium]
MLLDSYLKLTEPTLDGESTDTLHEKEISIVSFEQIINRANMLSQNDAGTENKSRSEHSPFRIIKLLDKTSPKLLEAACKGTLYKKAVLSLCQPNASSGTTSSSWKKAVYFEVTLENVHITRVHLMGDPTNVPSGIMNSEILQMGPLEQIDLSYRKIKWLYKGGTGTINISGSWNLGTNSNA